MSSNTQSKMIKLYYINGDIFIFDVEDWASLRTNHRIIGHLVGNTSNIPALPVKIFPEEALLLLKKNIAEIHETTNYIKDLDVEKKFENEFLLAQQSEYKTIRRQQLESLIDKIVANRHKAGDERSKEEIFNEELAKSCVVSKENMLWPILLQRKSEQNYKIIPYETVAELTSSLRTLIFCDLWERGYYITSGEKFGGDFLVYLGDPITHHAVFIVKCITIEKTFSPSALVAFGRLGVTVKKRAVYATVESGEVKYITVNWIDA